MTSREDKMIVLKQLRNLVCLLGENVHVLLNSESHWVYIEQVNIMYLPLTFTDIYLKFTELYWNFPDIY
jgi:hypothetical protein